MLRSRKKRVCCSHQYEWTTYRLETSKNILLHWSWKIPLQLSYFGDIPLLFAILKRCHYNFTVPKDTLLLTPLICFLKFMDQNTPSSSSYHPPSPLPWRPAPALLCSLPPLAAFLISIILSLHSPDAWGWARGMPPFVFSTPPCSVRACLQWRT